MVCERDFSGGELLYPRVANKDKKDGLGHEMTKYFDENGYF